MAKKKPTPAPKKPKGGRIVRVDDLPADLDISDRRTMESLMRELMGDVLGLPSEDDTPRGRARDLLDRAYAARTNKEREKLARQAIEVDPDSADAYMLLGDLADSTKDAVHFFEQGVAAGERAIGPEIFREEVGQFWGFLETRPYMRARERLAHALWKIGRKEEAAGHLREMLRLNPGDNQGVRDALAPWLIELGRDEEAAKLLGEYDEPTAANAYARALLSFRKHGDAPESRRALGEAEKANKHVPALLLGDEAMPMHGPGHYSPGDKNEAILYGMSALAGWKSTPGALTWLRGARKVPKKRVSKKDAPMGPSEIGQERLRRLPQFRAEWEADVRLLDRWVETKRGRVQPWVIMVVDRLRQAPLAFEILDDGEMPPPARLWDVLDKAMREPMMEESHRPTLIRFLKGKGWESLQGDLEGLEIACKSARKLAVLDSLFEDLEAHLGEGDSPGLLDAPGVTAELLAGVFRAAAEFYRRAPWKSVSPEGAIRVECDKFPGGPWYAYLMGQGGMTLGVALYDSLPLLRKLWKGKLSQMESIEETVALTLTFDTGAETPPKDLEAMRKHRWEVAGPEAIPNIFRKEKGMNVRPPLPWELELLEGCLRAIAEWVARGGAAGAKGAGRFVLPAGEGELELSLAWVE